MVCEIPVKTLVTSPLLVGVVVVLDFAGFIGEKASSGSMSNSYGWLKNASCSCRCFCVRACSNENICCKVCLIPNKSDIVLRAFVSNV